MKKRNESRDIKKASGPPFTRGHNFLYVPTDKSDHQLKLIGRIITRKEATKVLSLGFDWMLLSNLGCLFSLLLFLSLNWLKLTLLTSLFTRNHFRNSNFPLLNDSWKLCFNVFVAVFFSTLKALRTTFVHVLKTFFPACVSESNSFHR